MQTGNVSDGITVPTLNAVPSGRTRERNDMKRKGKGK
jgi:hypothetical protein